VALDIFVMPLSRYLSGDFMTGLERFMAAQGALHQYHRTSPKPSLPPEEARAFVADLRRQLAAALGPEIRWRDEGDTVFAEQFSFDAWHALRAFAADQTRPAPGFRFDRDPHRHPGLDEIFDGAPSSFRHLIRHHDNQGFYLPTDFREPFELPLWEGERAAPLVGSSLALLRELNALGARLGLTRDQGEEGWTEPFVRGDPLEPVKHGWVFMRHCARLSVRHKLPIIFDG